MILVTGADGFVGRALQCGLSDAVMPVRAVSRSKQPGYSQIGAIDGSSRWGELLTDVSAIVHLAARVHVVRDPAADPLDEFRRVNVAGTLNLARQAVDARVRRFIFISSIKVNGEGTSLNQPYTADDVPAPVDPYGISKLEAEQGLRRLAQETGLEVVIIRPVLVYGPGVKANFLSMMRWLHKGIPLPLGAIHNLRSLVALDNLADLIVTCLRHPAAANQTFLVSDGTDLSTTALLQRTAAALGRPARLFPMPVLALQAAARFVSNADFARRLCGSLQVDISKTRELLGWIPPVSVDAALKLTARHFLASLHGE